MTNDSNKRTEYTVEERAQEEGNKLFYDALKHLTTLSTGSILILATFLEKFFAKPYWKVLVVIAFVSFIFSIVAAVVSMSFVANRIYYHGQPDESSESFLMWSGIISVILFFIGIIAFIVFSLRNFYN